MDPWGPLPPGVYAPGGVFTYMMPDHDQQLQALPLPLPFHPGGSQSGTSRHSSGHMGSRVRLPPRPSRLSSVHRFPHPPDSPTPLNPSGSASFQSSTSGSFPRPRRRRRRSSSQSRPPPLTNASSQSHHHHHRRRRRRTWIRSERSTSHSPRGRRRSTRSDRSRRTLLPLTEEETTLHAPNDGNGEAQTHHSSPRLSSSSAAAVSRRSTTPRPPPPPDNTNNTSNSNTSYHTALPFLLSDHNTPVTDPIFRQAEASMVMAGEYPGAFTREEERVLYDLMMRARRPLTLPEAGRASWRFGRDFSGLRGGDYY